MDIVSLTQNALAERAAEQGEGLGTAPHEHEDQDHDEDEQDIHGRHRSSARAGRPTTIGGDLDTSHHPFCGGVPDDVRITTRVREDEITDALYSTLHECGHALYELGIDCAYEGTPLNNGTSAGVHESQSRMWENIVGRSRGFWEHFYPSLQREFPEQLGSVPIAVFHRAINKVARSTIRPDADAMGRLDECHLHVAVAQIPQGRQLSATRFAAPSPAQCRNSNLLTLFVNHARLMLIAKIAI